MHLGFTQECSKKTASRVNDAVQPRQCVQALVACHCRWTASCNKPRVDMWGVRTVLLVLQDGRVSLASVGLAVTAVASKLVGVGLCAELHLVL